MAPDLNSLPPSPHSPRHIVSMASRRAREIMAPSSASITPPAQSPTILSREQATMTSGDNTGVGIGPGMHADNLHLYLYPIIQLTHNNFPGPLRHPRPLTAADLHMQLEKEQEAVVSWGRSMTGKISLIRVSCRSTASRASFLSCASSLPR